MLNAVTRVNTRTPNMDSKCGEIHYQKGNWHYLCVFCGLIALTHDDFRSHLNSKHFNDFMYKEILFLEEETTCRKASKRKSVKTKLNDPLNWTPIEEECLGTFTTTEADNPPKSIAVQVLDDLNTCDVESNDCESLFREVSDSIEKDKSREDEKMENSFDESHMETQSLFSNESQNKSEIDWDTPFKPNYLKNSEKRPYRPRKQLFSCTYCGRTFRRRYQYDTHLHIHTGAKPHQCEICGRQFRAVATLQRHLTTHEKRYFTCKYCDKSFSHRPACLSHEKRHTQERSEPCDLCEKQFYTVNQLDTHKRRVHKMSNDELPFACDLCPKRYRTTSMLSIHKSKIHYKTAEFQCEKCEKKFVDLQRLEEHKKIHVDGRILTLFLNVMKTS